MGQLATNPLYFPISFKKWPDMPNSCLDRVFDEIQMARFLFRIDRQKAKRWAGGNLNKKWKDYRHKLWRAAEDPLLSKEEIIRKSANGAYPWINGHCLLIITSTRKQRNFARRISRFDKIKFLTLEMAKGKDDDRGKMWTETHKRKDGSYVTEEKVEEIRNQRPESITEVSPNDALGIVFGPELLGRVRGLSLDVVPTMAFKQTSRRFQCVNVSSSSTSAPTPE